MYDYKNILHYSNNKCGTRLIMKSHSNMMIIEMAQLYMDLYPRFSISKKGVSFMCMIRKGTNYY